MKNPSLAAKKTLKNKKESEKRQQYIASLLSSSRRTAPHILYTSYKIYPNGLEFDINIFNTTLDTAINMFIENVFEDLEWVVEDDYFYYLCDFPKHCEYIGVKFPDQAKVGRYGKTLENYNG